MRAAPATPTPTPTPMAVELGDFEESALGVPVATAVPNTLSEAVVAALCALDVGAEEDVGGCV